MNFRASLLTTIALCASAVMASSAFGQDKKVIRFLHNETDPPSIEYFNRVIAEFEAEHSDIDIEMETADNDGRLQKILASANTRTLPDVFKVITLENYEFVRRGFVSPLDDLVAEIGEEDFVPEAVTQIDGSYYAIPYTMGNQSNLYLRTDLFQEAGLNSPTTLQEMLDAALKLHSEGGDGTIGYIFPASNNRASTIFITSLIWSFGGTLFDEDLNVTFDSPETVAALAYIRDLAKAAPPSIGAYSYGDITNGYLSGKPAMVMAIGRLANALGANAPELLDKTNVIGIPAGPSGAGVKLVSTDGYAIASPEFGGENQEAAKEFVKFLMTGDRPKEFALTAFPHLIPPLRSVQEQVIAEGAAGRPRLADMARTIFDVSNSLDFSTEAGATIVDGKVVPSGVENPYIGAIIARFIPALAAQRVIFEGEEPEAAAAWGQAEMERVVEELKTQ